MADDGDQTNVTETNATGEEDATTSAKGETVELVSLNSDKKDNEDDNEEDDIEDTEEKKDIDLEEIQHAQDTIHEDSEDSKQYYKLDDFELEYNVKGLRERFEKLVTEYSGFEEDIYTVKEKELMDILGNLAIDSYGILLWILCMDQLETERKKIIWDILIFLAMRMPTQVAMDLLIHYSSNMARYSPTDVSELGKALVHGSQFPLATCLVLSAFFLDAAKKDLTRDKQLRQLSKEYAIRATTILEEIENDYLAVIMLETPSFHENSKSPLEIALEHDIIDFLSCNKVSRISNAMWTLPNLMQVGADTQSAFALSDFSAGDIHQALLQDSYSFYFSSMGYFTVEVVTYLLYLAMFTYLTHLRTPVDDPPTWVDYIFWVGNVGFVLGELIELGYEGWREYLSKWQNWLDVVICVNFVLIIIIRSFVTIFSTYSDAFSDMIGDDDDNNVNILSLIYKNIWALNVVILWLRLLHFMLLSRAIGPLITNIKNMLKDIASFGKMYVLILLGFVFGLYFLIGGENRNVLFETINQSVITLTKTTLGQLEWECVRDLKSDEAVDSSVTSTTGAPVETGEDCQCDYENGCDYLETTNDTRGDLATILLIIFSLLTLVVLFNLLTAMMATTFRLITERSDKEVLSRKVALGVEYDKQNQVMPPPFNMLVLILFVIYSTFDALLLFFTQKFISESYGKMQWKCEDCNCLNEYDADNDAEDVVADIEATHKRDRDSLYEMGIGKNDSFIQRTLSMSNVHICQLCGTHQTNIRAKRRYWRNPRQYSDGDGRWKTLLMGLKELFDIQDKDVDNKNRGRSSFKQHEKNVSVMEHHKDANKVKEDEDIMDERMIMEKRIKRKDWICGYCRNRIPAGRLGDIETFKGRLFNDDVRVDEDDIEAIQQINPLLCPICYRVVSVRSRIIFIMEVISYFVFLFILYPVVRICLMPVYFFQALYAWTNNDDTKNEGDSGHADGTLDAITTTSIGDEAEAKKLQEIEDLLPSDTQTRALLNPQHKIWKILKHYQKKQNKIEVTHDAKIAHDESVKAKRKRKMDEEKLQRQRGKIVAQLGVLIDKYWKTRLAASEKHRLETKKDEQRLKEIQRLKSDLDEY